MKEKTVTVTGTIKRGTPVIIPCGIITPETQTQTGMQADRHLRLFFGDQTEVQERFSPEDAVTVTGYIKERKNLKGEIYWDDRAIFVTHITRG